MSLTRRKPLLPSQLILRRVHPRSDHKCHAGYYISTMTDQRLAARGVSLRAAAFYPLQRRLVYVRPRRADARLMNELRHRFKPEVEKLSEYLGRDFISLWGYDRLD